jgi:hypothetical protein
LFIFIYFYLFLFIDVHVCIQAFVCWMENVGGEGRVLVGFENTQQKQTKLKK